MKITRRQLGRIIRESEYRGMPEPGDSVPNLGDYIAWASREGHVTWSASSVLATYLVEERPRDWERAGPYLADEAGLEWEDVARDVARQQTERSIALGESAVKVSKRQLRRIIKEEKAKLSEGYVDTSPAIEAIEKILNDLWDQGATNVQLKELLDQVLVDIDRGFVGEPT